VKGLLRAVVRAAAAAVCVQLQSASNMRSTNPRARPSRLFRLPVTNLRDINFLIFVFYPYPTKWGRYNMFSSCCDKHSVIVFTTGRLPDVSPP
jgi:hypothetical protein